MFWEAFALGLQRGTFCSALNGLEFQTLDDFVISTY